MTDSQDVQSSQDAETEGSPSLPVPHKKHTKRMRHDVRAYTVQLMYSLELNHYDSDENLAIAGGEPTADLCALSEKMMESFISERIAIDACVDKYLQNWTLLRLAYVDRAILRTGAYEIMYNIDAPPSVLINDYVELAKEFGSDGKTSKLVNAVLDKVAREHRASEMKHKK